MMHLGGHVGRNPLLPPFSGVENHVRADTMAERNICSPLYSEFVLPDAHRLPGEFTVDRVPGGYDAGTGSEWDRGDVAHLRSVKIEKVDHIETHAMGLPLRRMLLPTDLSLAETTDVEMFPVSLPTDLQSSECAPEKLPSELVARFSQSNQSRRIPEPLGKPITIVLSDSDSDGEAGYQKKSRTEKHGGWSSGESEKKKGVKEAPVSSPTPSSFLTLESDSGSDGEAGYQKKSRTEKHGGWSSGESEKKKGVKEAPVSSPTPSSFLTLESDSGSDGEAGYQKKSRTEKHGGWSSGESEKKKGVKEAPVSSPTPSSFLTPEQHASSNSKLRGDEFKGRTPFKSLKRKFSFIELDAVIDLDDDEPEAKQKPSSSRVGERLFAREFPDAEAKIVAIGTPADERNHRMEEFVLVKPEWEVNGVALCVYREMNIFALETFELSRIRWAEIHLNIDPTGKGWRADLKVGSEMKKNGMWVNGHRPIGECPGVRIGDCFVYMVEMAIIGLHRVVQAGISTIPSKYNPYGRSIAASIVMNVHDNYTYKDNKDMGDKVTYSGQGGLAKGKAHTYTDQKTWRGNSALINNEQLNLPVRMIRGYKMEGTSTGTLYSYDGLYRVIDHEYQTGVNKNQVYLFHLVRLPGQPPIKRPSVSSLLYSALSCLQT